MLCRKGNFFRIPTESYSRASKLHSTDINILTNRGECYLHLGRFLEAAQDLKTAILLDPEEKNQAANRARFLSILTFEALKLAEEGGQQAVIEAKRWLNQQLKQQK